MCYKYVPDMKRNIIIFIISFIRLDHITERLLATHSY